MEEWRIVAEFPNLEVSNFGNVRKKDTLELLCQSNDKDGYKYIHINKTTRKVHRLVGIAFIDNPEKKPHIDHIDKTKINNNVSNLRWATAKENNLNKNFKNIYILKVKGGYSYWCVSYTGVDKKHVKTFKTENEAQAYLDELKIKHPRNL